MGIRFRFGAYEFLIAFLKEFFPKSGFDKTFIGHRSQNSTFILSEIAYFLGKLGRNAEAMTLSKVVAELAIESSDFKSAAIAYQSIASNIVTTGGKLSEAQVFAITWSRICQIIKIKTVA